MVLEYLKEIFSVATVIGSAFLAIVWSVLANLITPRVQSWLVKRRKSKHKNIDKAKAVIEKAEKFKEEIGILERRKDFRYELKLDGIHKQATATFISTVAILFLWWGSSYQILLLLVPMSVFMFFVATRIFDKGVDDYYKSSLASSRAQIIAGWEDLPEEEKNKKIKELNNDDFGID